MMREYFDEPKRWGDKKLNRIVTGFGLIVIIFFFSWVYNFINPSPKTTYVNSNYSSKSETDAFYMSREFVLNRLKAPASAEFASYSESSVLNEDLNTWRIKSYVDSQNIFGAMLRTRYTIKIMYIVETNKWRELEFISN